MSTKNTKDKASPSTSSATVKTTAVIETGGKQYTVSVGSKLRVEKLNLEKGQEVTFSRVLMVNSGEGAIKIGSPYLEGASVTAKVITQTKDKKVLIYKKIITKGYTKKQGHRQAKTEIEIGSIQGA